MFSVEFLELFYLFPAMIFTGTQKFFNPPISLFAKNRHGKMGVAMFFESTTAGRTTLQHTAQFARRDIINLASIR